MFDNFIRHRILGRIISYKQMFHFKKGDYISISNMHEFFPPEKRFDQALINLYSRGYISLKKEDNVQMVNIEEPGVFAFSNDTLRKEQYKFWWTYIKDGLTLFATILMAIIAIIALKKDTTKFVDKEELKEVQYQLFQVQTQASKTDSLLRIYQSDVNSTKKPPLPVDTPSLTQNPVDNKEVKK